MNIQPTLAAHYHQEFHFADNTESTGCCCFWKSKGKAPSQFYIDEAGVLHSRKKTKYRERIVANQRLGELIKKKFDHDPIENDKAFEMLKDKINDSMENGEPITSEKLGRIVSAIYELKREISQSPR